MSRTEKNIHSEETACRCRGSHCICERASGDGNDSCDDGACAWHGNEHRGTSGGETPPD